ncbi:MAG: sensor histidine kinase, partial [Verrucomicrobia bacterium]|nr:sensor histidine kinase [Cytophagales bacterium]
MKNRTFRWVILLAVVSVTGIIALQLYWLRQAFDLEDGRFNHNVNIALKNVADSVCHLNRHALPESNPVYRFAANHYFVAVNDQVDAAALEYYLKNEFDSRHLNLDFEYGIYDCEGDRMIYGNYVKLSNFHKTFSPRTDLPKWEDKVYYFSVFFPDKNLHLASQMGIWILSSGVLLVILAFFGYAMFVMFKQKRLSEIQKDFINNMTHELKTPIATLAIAGNVLKNDQILSQPERL